jgi:hypothetical protein
MQVERVIKIQMQPSRLRPLNFEARFRVSKDNINT